MFSILKSKSKGYQPKKAKVFEYEDVQKFLNEAPDEKYLLMKTVVVMGIMGACRCDELVNLKMTDIVNKQSIVVVNILKTKNYKPRSFVITDVEGGGFNGLEIYRKYAALRSSIMLGEGRFFLSYYYGKCTVQPVGINTISKIPRLVAEYLGMNDAHLYTGHSFRRTSATLLAHVSGDILTLKRHGGWRSTSVAEGYVEESESNKIKIARKLITGEEGTTKNIQAQTNKTDFVKDTHTAIASNNIFNNCTVNFNISY